MNDENEDHPVDEPAIEAALLLARAGLSVIPIKCDGSKQPAINKWKTKQEVISTRGEILREFKGRVGIAIICGKVSRNLETLDIDAPELVEPFESTVRALAPGLLERLSTVATPRGNEGGRHYRYRIDGDVGGSTKLAQSEPRPQFNDDGDPVIDPKTGEQRLAPDTLIETRGEGSYAIAPGSPPECHKTGITYKHCAGPPLTEIPIITGDERALLLAIARSFNFHVEQHEVITGAGCHRSGDSPGDDYSARTNWNDILLPEGWTKVSSRGEITYWRRPGKSTGISATTGMRSTTGTELLCVFSTNAAPFEGPKIGRACSSFSKFAAFAFINHNGNFPEAAKALRAAGYGDPPSAKKSVAKPTLKLMLPEAFELFPVHFLPPVCAEFVRQTAASIGCDESMVALSLIAGLAACIGNSRWIELKRGYPEPPIIWGGVVSESGTRKSSAIESPLRHIRKREGEELKRHTEDLQKYRAAIQVYKNMSAQCSPKKADESVPFVSEPTKPTCSRLTVSDITAEALAVTLEQNPRGLLLVGDELSGFFAAFNQYKSGGKGSDEAAYLTMHGARPLLIDRKNLDRQRICVPYASLSIIGSIQPGILRRAFTRERRESGLAARFLLVYPPPRVSRWSEKSVDPEVESLLASMLDRLLSLELGVDEETKDSCPILLPLAPEAKPFWIKFHDERSAEQAALYGDLSAAWAKITGCAARLSLICELVAWASNGHGPPPHQVGVSAIQAGIELARWFANETMRIYAILDEDVEQRDVRQLIDYIKQQGGTVTPRQLSRGPRRYRNNVELAESDLQKLVQLGGGIWIDQPTGDQGGRPTRAFCLFRSGAGDETSEINE